jgi:CheY-like chemotaxis protein
MVTDKKRASNARLYPCASVLSVVVPLVALFASLLWCNPAVAQDAKEKGKKDAKAEPTKVEPVVKDPLVQTVLELVDPEKAPPDDLVYAVQTLVELGQPIIARRYVDKLAAAKLSDEELAALGRKYGTTTFIKMSVPPPLNPPARQFANRVLEATRKIHRSPKRLAELIEKLKSPSVQQRGAATAELAFGGDAAVNALLAVLTDTNRAAEHANVRAALAGLGSHSIEPLLGALETKDPLLKAQVIEVLYHLDARESLLYLLAPALSSKTDKAPRQAAQGVLAEWLTGLPTSAQAQAALERQARYFFAGAQPTTPDAEGNITLWHWDAAKRQVVARAYKAEDASLVVAQRLAGQWLELDPKNREAQLIYLTCLLQLGAYQSGLDKPLAAGKSAPREEAATFGAGVAEEVLARSMEEGRFPAATAVARLLGEIGKEALLHRPGGKPAALVQAAAHADPRLRLAAVEAILKLKPQKPFAGSHHVPQTLSHFAATTGVLRVLVADANPQEAQRLAGLLAALDYDSETTISGRQMAKRLAASPDFAFALFSTALPYTDPDQFIQQIRREPRTATLPLGLISTSAEIERYERLTKKFPRTAVFVRTREVEGMRFQVKQLMDTVGRDFVTREERLQHARQSLAWMAELTAAKESLYDFKPYEELLEAPMYVPELTPRAAVVLANLGTPFGQRTLVNVASTSSLPIEVRQAAAAGFRRGYERFGILLTRQEVLRQYDRYNSSELADKATQDVLGSILDTIELARKKSPDAGKAEASKPMKK